MEDVLFLFRGGAVWSLYRHVTQPLACAGNNDLNVKFLVEHGDLLWKPSGAISGLGYRQAWSVRMRVDGVCMGGSRGGNVLWTPPSPQTRCFLITFSSNNKRLTLAAAVFQGLHTINLSVRDLFPPHTHTQADNYKPYLKDLKMKYPLPAVNFPLIARRMEESSFPAWPS